MFKYAFNTNVQKIWIHHRKIVTMSSVVVPVVNSVQYFIYLFMTCFIGDFGLYWCVDV